MPGSRVEPAYVHPDNAGPAEKIYPAGCGLPSRPCYPPSIPWSGTARVPSSSSTSSTRSRSTPRQPAAGTDTTPSILHNGALVGRLDAKAHRKQGTFEVKAIHLEPDTPVNDDLVSGLAGALRDCAGWHGTPEVLVRRSDPSELTETLRLALDEAAPPLNRGDNLATTKSANSSSGQAESEYGNQAVCAYTHMR